MRTCDHCQPNDSYRLSSESKAHVGFRGHCISRNHQSCLLVIRIDTRLVSSTGWRDQVEPGDGSDSNGKSTRSRYQKPCSFYGRLVVTSWRCFIFLLISGWGGIGDKTVQTYEITTTTFPLIYRAANTRGFRSDLGHPQQVGFPF